MSERSEAKRMQLVAVIQRGEGTEKKNFWTKIGVAFQNKDGSYNLRFDYLPAQMSAATIQLRELDAKEGAAAPPGPSA
jgi:hypothetical protein